MKKEKSYPLLLQWMRSWEIPETMHYLKAAEHQACFVRDELCRDLLHVPVFVISTHHSKSIKLPVYRFRMQNGIIVTMRDNFYGWVVSLKRPREVNLPEDIVHGDAGKDVTCCEGFSDDWVYPYSTERVRLTTFRVDDEYRLFALFRELNNKYKVVTPDRGLDEGLTATIIRQQMEVVDDVDVNEVFSYVWYNYAYDLDWCKENNLKSFFHADKDLSDEKKKEAEIKDFAHRICMNQEAANAFHTTMECLWIGRIEENGL
jgi:hypothetical protein